MEGDVRSGRSSRVDTSPRERWASEMWRPAILAGQIQICMPEPQCDCCGRECKWNNGLEEFLTPANGNARLARSPKWRPPAYRVLLPISLAGRFAGVGVLRSQLTTIVQQDACKKWASEG